MRRCLLCELIKDDPKILTDLVDLPNVIVPQNPHIIPCGVEKPQELIFNKPISKDFINKLLHHNQDVDFQTYKEFKKKIEGWWLKHPERANTPNWDIACIAEIDGKYGMILVEAKAHEGELSRSRKSKSTESKKSQENLTKIGTAIEEASGKLSNALGTNFNLSLESPYQLTNRFAWSWKLANLKIPVVLVSCQA